MKNILFYILLAFFIISCNGNSKKNNDNNYNSTEVEEIVEDSYEAKKEGYNKGYEDGYNDGYGWYEHGVSYNSRNHYLTDDAISSFKKGYDAGYNDGYSEGEAKKKAEKERERLSDWHNWEDEDVDALYVYLDGVEDDDVADYIAHEHYEGEYIRVGFKYYAKVDYTWGEYEITLGERISSDLYKIRGSDIYIHFKWGLPDVSSGDEGVLDWSGSFSSFYKKPDNL